MPERLFLLYQRKRIINVNANIIAAGLGAICLTLIPVSLTRLFIGPDLTPRDSLIITAIAGVSDMVFDVTIYYVLHFVANHWRPIKARRRKDVEHQTRKPPPFFRDATLIQFQRALLSPIYYIVALSLKLTLLKHGEAREVALVVGFVSALIVTRIIHTAWGLWTGRMRD